MKYLYCLVVFFLGFGVVSAQVEITEIMYDVEGSDSGREWVEISNISDKSVDLTGWKFFEAEQNHKLNIFQGEVVLPARGIAIIADNPAKFLVDWSNFSGTIFDSSFSLKKVGENIAIRDSEKNDVDSLVYVPQDFADGNGASLQKIGNTWSAQTPTPGIVNKEQSPSVSQENKVESSPEVQEVKSQQQSTSISWTTEQQIFTRIKNMNKIVVVGADIIFSGEALGLEKEFLSNARYLWTFGDGGTKTGEKVLHTYNYPGKYIVILNTSSGKYSASDRIHIEVIPADIVISSVGIGKPREAFVEVQNNTKYELDLSGWRLRAGNKFFTIPKNTIILKKNRIVFSGEYTKFDIKKDYVVELLYPNNNIVFPYTWLVDMPEVRLEKIKVASIPKLIVSKSNKVEPKKTIKEKSKQKSIVLKTEEVKPVIDFAIVNDRQLAVVSNTDIVKKDGIYKWVAALVGMIFLSVSSYFVLKKNKIIESSLQNSVSVSEIPSQNADEYEIEVIKENKK